MNLKTFIPLLLAIGLGLVAAKVARDTLNKKNQPAQQGNFKSVVMTKQGLPPGHELSADDLTLGQVSPDSVPEQSFTSIAEVLNRTVKVELVKGQAVVETLLAEAGTGSGLQALVPAGMRAITIEVNEFSGLAGMVTPGSRVDVVATIQGSNGDEMSARTVVQNVKVTAVGQRVTSKPDPKEDPAAQQQIFRSVTLICTPEEAETIELANTTGRPWLVLRGNKDEDRVETAGITISDLRGANKGNRGRNDPFLNVSNPAPSTQPSQVRAPERIAMNTRTVQVIRGGTETTVTLTLPSIQGSDITGTEYSPEE